MAIEYIFNPDLKTIKPGYPGNKVIDSKLANGEELYLPDFKKVLKWQLTRNPQKAEKVKDKFAPPVIQNPDIFKTQEDCLVWLGHATFFI